MTIENINPNDEEVNLKFVIVYGAIVLFSCITLVTLVVLFKK